MQLLKSAVVEAFEDILKEHLPDHTKKDREDMIDELVDLLDLMVGVEDDTDVDSEDEDDAETVWEDA